MFGHQDDQSYQQQDTNQIPDQSINEAMVGDDQPAQNEVQPTDATWQAAQPAQTVSPTPVSPASPATPVSDGAATSNDTDAASSDTSTSDLIELKQQALSQLSPLLGHLHQTPEEKFRTTMMMIQASDNAGMVKTAFEAAQGISDEKLRAQALLDVVNEINYFTQNQTD